MQLYLSQLSYERITLDEEVKTSNQFNGIASAEASQIPGLQLGLYLHPNSYFEV
jgi:hypothetical protein